LRAFALWNQLSRAYDYPTRAADWARLCAAPRALSGPHDWGLAIGPALSFAGGRCRVTPLGELLAACRHEGDEAAEEALAALLARFMQHLELGREFDLACTLPAGYISGDDDSTSGLFGRPGVDYPLAIRRDLFAWNMAAGLHAARVDRAMTLTRRVAGLRMLLLCDVYRLDPLSSAVHLLRAGDASRVGVLALCADLKDCLDL